MRKVLLETQNPLDLTVEELTDLARIIQSASKSVKVMVGYKEQRGAGVSFVDVLYFWVPDAEFLRDALYAYMIERCLNFMRARRKRKHAGQRPITIIVVLPDGTEIEVITDEKEVDPSEPRERRSEPRRPPTKQVDPDGDQQ